MEPAALQREVEITVEQAPFPIVRISPSLPASERSGRRGPLYAAQKSESERYVGADVEELLAFSGARCRLAGAPVVVSTIADSWRAALTVLPSDLEPIVFALEALLDGDRAPLRSYLRNAPPADRASDQRSDRPWNV